MNLDSSILILHLPGDVHKDKALTIIGQLDVEELT